MIVGSIKENISLEKRISITPESAKNIIALGLNVCLETNYAKHIGIDNQDYENVGVTIFNSAEEVIKNCNLLMQVECPSDQIIKNIKEKTILIGIFNPSKNQSKLEEIIKKI